MTPSPSHPCLPALFARVWRIRLARYAMKTSNLFAALAERIMPEDLRRW
jgi:hypothetical protein